MQNLLIELERLLDEIPIYASWRVGELEQIFFRYSELLHGIAETKDGGKYKWLTDHIPDLHDRIMAMVGEKDHDKQSRQFDTIVFELRNAIDVLLSKIDCKKDDWSSLLAGKFPNKN